MIVIDYHLDIPNEDREDFIMRYGHFRCWVEGNDPDNDLFIQGHPGMSEEFIRDRIVFSETISGETYDLWTEHSYKNGVHQESYWCYNHCEGTYHDNLTVEEYNEYFYNL